MNKGCETKPTARSVPAKQASSMLYSDCNLRRVFIAMIINTFIKMITGQDPKLRAVDNKLMTVFSKTYSLNLPRQLIEKLRTESVLLFISFFKGISGLCSVDILLVCKFVCQYISGVNRQLWQSIYFIDRYIFIPRSVFNGLRSGFNGLKILGWNKPFTVFLFTLCTYTLAMKFLW